MRAYSGMRNDTFTRSGRCVRAESTSATAVAPKALQTLLLIVLVLHKSLTDGLSRHTRVNGAPYSATTASILGEVVKVPILIVAILIFEGKEKLIPIVREALADRPFEMCVPSALWAGQNVLYFVSLSNIDAASYQLLSQTKVLFTALFMTTFLGVRLRSKQYLALVLLCVGSICTQLAESSEASSVAGGNALYGGLATVAGAGLSALPNVRYEQRLKRAGSNQWAQNMQVTFWINIWLIVFAIPSLIETSTVYSTRTSMWSGITLQVGVVCLLQSLKCVLIPATLKYSDNYAMSYCKPASIVLNTLVGSVGSGTAPSVLTVIGMYFITHSTWLYNT